MTGGGGGIRTHGTRKGYNGFRDRYIYRSPLLLLWYLNLLVGVLVGKTNEPEISRQVGENGGGGGIRTHGARKGTTVFETV